MLISHRSSIQVPAPRNTSLSAKASHLTAHADCYTPSLRFGVGDHMKPKFEPSADLNKLTQDTHRIIQESSEDILPKIKSLVAIAEQPAIRFPVDDIEEKKRAKALLEGEIASTIFGLMKAQADYLEQNPTDETARKAFKEMQNCVKACNNPAFPKDTFPFFVLLNNISKPTLQLHQLLNTLRETKNKKLIEEISQLTLRTPTHKLTEAQQTELEKFIRENSYEKNAPANESPIDTFLQRLNFNAQDSRMIKSIFTAPLNSTQIEKLSNLIRRQSEAVSDSHINDFTKTLSLTGLQLDAWDLEPFEELCKKDFSKADQDLFISFIKTSNGIEAPVHGMDEKKLTTFLTKTLGLELGDAVAIEQIFKKAETFDLSTAQLNKTSKGITSNLVFSPQAPLLSEKEMAHLIIYNQKLKFMEETLKSNQSTDKKIEALFNELKATPTLYEKDQGIRNGFFKAVMVPQILKLMTQKLAEVLSHKVTLEEFEVLKHLMQTSPAWAQGLFNDHKGACKIILEEKKYMPQLPLFDLFHSINL